MEKNERQLALKILLDIYQNGGYSNLSLAKYLPKTGSGFVTALVYGVVERDLTLTYLVDHYSKKPCNKLDLEVALILKMGLYQLLYLDGVADNVAVNETVKLCYTVKKVSAKGLINGILRNFIRDGKRVALPQEKKQEWSIRYSCPEWLIQKWCAEYGEVQTEKILQASLGRPPLTVRVNTLKITPEELKSRLIQKGITVKETDLPNAFFLEHTGNLGALAEFKEGLFYVQDLSSQICGAIAAPQAGGSVFDLCAAPGSKTFTMAMEMRGKGNLYAFDLYPHKLELIEKTAQKLGIENLKTAISDGSVFHPELGQADSVLCDVPCSGLGIIRRKPEIKYKEQDTLQELPALQYQILTTAAAYVKPGGKLVYSTCALSQKENERQADRFLREHTEFIPEPLPTVLVRRGCVTENKVTFFPEEEGGDGFFVALFRKKK